MAENARRGRHDPEYELLDTGVFDDDRYWVVEVDYAKADPARPAHAVRVPNAGPDAATLHVLPTAVVPQHLVVGRHRRSPRWPRRDGGVAVDHPLLGALELSPARPDGAARVGCSATTRPTPRASSAPARRRRYPKDGINDHVVDGAATVNPDRARHQGAAWYRVDRRGRRRPSSCACGWPPDHAPDPSGPEFAAVIAARKAEADEFYAELAPAGATADEALVMRQAFAGMLWSKQFYHYDVARWLDGDPAQPPPPPERHRGRNARWRTFDAYDVISMPDTWEYPWFAAWDLAFHCVALAHVDPAFAKYQLSCCAASGSSTPTARCPRTSGTSATSTRPCTRGRRSRSSPSTAGTTSTSSPGCSTSCWSTSPGG